MVTRRSLKFSGESHEIFSAMRFGLGAQGRGGGPTTPPLFSWRPQKMRKPAVRVDVADDAAQIRLKKQTKGGFA